MITDTNKIKAERALARAEGGILFLKQCLEKIHRGSTDAMFSRSVYILFSYNFELVLKSLLIIKNVPLDRLMHHDLSKLSNQIGEEELALIGIKNIFKDNKNFTSYTIQLLNKHVISIQDFVDVRYDFKKPDLRSCEISESENMKKDLLQFEEMTGKIREMLKP